MKDYNNNNNNNNSNKCDSIMILNKISIIMEINLIKCRIINISKNKFKINNNKIVLNHLPKPNNKLLIRININKNLQNRKKNKSKEKVLLK